MNCSLTAGRDSAMIPLKSDCLLRTSEAVSVDVEGYRKSAHGSF